MKGSSVIIFILGAAAGAAGMYFATKKMYENSLEAEMDELKKYYKDKYETEEEPELIEDKTIVEDDKPVFERSSKKVAEVKEYDAVMDKLQYNRITRDSKDIPYEIEEEEYDEDTMHEHVFCTYFTDDEVMVDTTTDEQILDYIKEMGADNIDNLVNNEETVMYVANDKLGRMYEITREDHISYEDYVNGDNS